MRSRLLVFAVLLGVVACNHRGPKGPAYDVATFKFEPLGPARPAATEPPVKLNWCSELPVGFRLPIQQGDLLEAVAGYPTADDPHRVLGKVIAIMPPPRRDVPDDIYEQNRREDL